MLPWSERVLEVRSLVARSRENGENADSARDAESRARELLTALAREAGLDEVGVALEGGARTEGGRVVVGPDAFEGGLESLVAAVEAQRPATRSNKMRD